MIEAYAVADVRAAEAAAMAGLPEGELMARAAQGLAAVVAARLEERQGMRVVGLVGSGNNGGDALYALADLAERHLAGRVGAAGQVHGDDPGVLGDRLDPLGGRSRKSGPATDPEQTVHDDVGLPDETPPVPGITRNQRHAGLPRGGQPSRVRARGVDRRCREPLLGEVGQRIQRIAPVVPGADESDDAHAVPLPQPSRDHRRQSPRRAGHQLALR